MHETLLTIDPEKLSPEERLNFWKKKAIELYQYCQANGISIIFRGSLHAEAIKPGFLSDGYKQDKKQWRDLDIYIPAENISSNVVSELERIAHPIPLGLSGNQIIKKINDNFFLCYKDIKVAVNKELFDPVFLSVDGEMLPFFDPQVHAHLFGTIGFANRSRDRGKKRLYESTESKYKGIPNAEYNELFSPFYQYRRIRAIKYPVQIILHKIRGNIPAPKNMSLRKFSRWFFNSLDTN
ncbi:MAG: hypothetical protein BroJett025_09960 [Patescibacteria group bacterium]|nr:MAG: hypothetical protein BroJett025_09960 [Patescibacteria group bacterium]